MRIPAILFIYLYFTSTALHGQTEIQDKKNDELKINSVEIDDPILIEGLEINDFNHKQCIQLKDGSMRGLAENYFQGESAKYDITIFYIDEPDGKAELKLTIDNQPIGNIHFDTPPTENRRYSLKRKILPGKNIWKGDKITLQFIGNGKEKCRIEKLVFTPTGTYDGILKKLIQPNNLLVFENEADRLMGRRMLPTFVNSRIDSLMINRVNILNLLKTPEQWKAQQAKTRGQLEEFFGVFPERNLLNAKITGKIEHEKYTIEKLYYESQPAYYVPGNLYLPKNRKGPFPAILFTIGHSDSGKASSLYHQACLGLVLQGYVVLAMDPMGQGERLEYFNTDTKEANVEGAVSQHYYLGRPSFLVNWTLSGLRTWDCIRAVDYLVSRPEVDTARLGVMGNSGGGQMALLITAVDERIKVCAAAHPGGQMEKNYLPGQNLFDRQIFSLIAPRPVRVIVGDKSGEEAPHRKKVEDIQLFMKGMGYDENRAQLMLVDGIHDLKQPKREAAYEWLNKWLGKEDEGKQTQPLNPEDEKDIWVTKSGHTLISLGGETGQSLNVQRLDTIYKPAKGLAELKNRVANRIGLSIEGTKCDLKARTIGILHFGDISVEKLTYQSEEGIVIPSLLIKPQNVNPISPIFIYASDKGKPRLFQETGIPFLLANKGFIVLAIDVRGIGETSPTPTLPLPVKYSTCTPMQWIHDCLAIQSPGFGRTMLGMRTYDLIRGVDFLNSRKDLQGKKVIFYGEGLGGLWASLASIYGSQSAGLITEGTLGSYQQLINNKYYSVSSDYFWVPGALCDFDIPDLARLVVSKPQIWMNPINELGKKLSLKEAESIIGSNKTRHILFTNNKNLNYLKFILLKN